MIHMKIYFTKKSIPELSELPPDLRRKNFKDAYNAISTHIEFWVGAGIAFICILFFLESMIISYLDKTRFQET